MNTFNLFIFLWQVSLCISGLFFVIGIWKKSALYMIISFFAFFPVSYYFIGAENSFKVIAFIPIILLILTIFFWKTNESK